MPGFQKPLFSLRDSGGGNAVYCVAFTGGDRIISGTSDGRVQQWNMKSRMPEWTLEDEGDPSAIFWANMRGDKNCMSQSRSGYVKNWDIEGGRCLSSVHTGSMSFAQIALMDGGNFFATPTSTESKVNVYDMMRSSDACFEFHEGENGQVMAMASLDDKLAVAYEGRKINIWDMKKPNHPISCIQLEKIDQPLTSLTSWGSEVLIVCSVCIVVNRVRRVIRMGACTGYLLTMLTYP
eukprot:GHVO01016487.1.p1 GENE.GHVO01016487.1~~GHVO01016487.1.p1  ORF type:complete len:236 (+),score=29.57 GHVO01016487.1:19-726(+)